MENEKKKRYGNNDQKGIDAFEELLKSKVKDGTLLEFIESTKEEDIKYHIDYKLITPDNRIYTVDLKSRPFIIEDYSIDDQKIDLINSYEELKEKIGVERMSMGLFKDVFFELISRKKKGNRDGSLFGDHDFFAFVVQYPKEFGSEKTGVRDNAATFNFSNCSIIIISKKSMQKLFVKLFLSGKIEWKAPKSVKDDVENKIRNGFFKKMSHEQFIDYFIKNILYKIEPMDGSIECNKILNTQNIKQNQSNSSEKDTDLGVFIKPNYVLENTSFVAIFEKGYIKGNVYSEEINNFYNSINIKNK